MRRGGCSSTLNVPDASHDNTDLVIYTVGGPSGQPSVIAYATACRRDQKGRPVVGMVSEILIARAPTSSVVLDQLDTTAFG